VISGEPTEIISGGFSVTVTDSVGASATGACSITIHSPVIFVTPSVANWTVNQPGYNQTFIAGAGTGSLTFTAAGSLPPGLTFSTTGVLAGTPTKAGNFGFVVTATDTTGSTASRSFGVVINQPITVTTSVLANWTVNVLHYSQTIAASGGTGAKAFAATGTLPPGLTLSTGSNTATLSGTPSAAGSFTFTVTASDTTGASGSETYTVTINPTVTITTSSLPNWTIGIGGYLTTIMAFGWYRRPEVFDLVWDPAAWFEPGLRRRAQRVTDCHRKLHIYHTGERHARGNRQS
jgi:large repetitive protein